MKKIKNLETNLSRWLLRNLFIPTRIRAYDVASIISLAVLANKLSSSEIVLSLKPDYSLTLELVLLFILSLLFISIHGTLNRVLQRAQLRASGENESGDTYAIYMNLVSNHRTKLFLRISSIIIISILLLLFRNGIV